MTKQARTPWSGFYKLTLEARRVLAARVAGIHVKDLKEALADGGLEVRAADKTVENVIGTYAMPFSLGLNFRINGRACVAPMVVEEPSVVAAASFAAKLIGSSGGFAASTDAPHMIAQVELLEVPDVEKARAQIVGAASALCELADRAVPNLVARGGGARSVETRVVGEGSKQRLIVHIAVDTRDAMGANLVNTVAEHLAPELARLGAGKVGLRILSNLADQRLVRVRARIDPRTLETPDRSGEFVRDAIVSASELASLDPYRAATHNKGIMNGVDAVVIAFGNDWRAVEAGAHAYAARTGQYLPLCTWQTDADGFLIGKLEMPLALGVVGGSIRIHRGAQLALRFSDIERASDLAILAASVGMASNFASASSTRNSRHSAGTYASACTHRSCRSRSNGPACRANCGGNPRDGHGDARSGKSCARARRTRRRRLMECRLIASAMHRQSNTMKSRHSYPSYTYSNKTTDR